MRIPPLTIEAIDRQIEQHAVEFVLWEACVRRHGLLEQIPAAAAAGFTATAITPHSLRRALDEGANMIQIKQLAHDHGVRLACLDTVTDWTDVRVPEGASDELRERFDFTLDHCLRICAELEIDSMLAVGGFGPGAIPLAAQVEGFGQLCARAAGNGIWVDLEFMPVGGVADLADAWAIVEQVDAPNSGILVDTWHFWRGSPDLDLLDQIPGERLVNVQVADGAQHQLGTTLVDDTLHFRSVPGRGELPLVQLLSRLAEKGHLRSIGPEIFSDQLDAIGAVDAANASAQGTAEIARQSGIALSSSRP